MYRTATAAVVALGLATAASASTVQNGSFEDLGGQSISNWDIYADIPGWDGGDEGIEIQTDGTIGAVDAQDGDYYAELDSNANTTISQDITLDVGSYHLTFYYSPRVKSSTVTNDMDFGIENVFGDSIVGAPNDDYEHGEWTLVTQYFIVDTAGTYTLFFSGAGAENEKNGCGDCGALLDNVAISAVPLPMSGLLLLAGIGGLGLARRRGQIS